MSHFSVGDIIQPYFSLSGFPPPKIEGYQWLRNDSIISGSTGITYQIGTADIGSIISVQITAINLYGSTASNISIGDAVTGSTTNFAPTFTGTPQGSTLTPYVGERLEFLNYGSTGVPEPVTSFQWYDDDVVISGATGYAYVVGATGELADAKKTIIVTVATSGYGDRFYFDGVENPANYPLSRGIEYIFDQSDSSNAGHPLVLKNGEVNYAWTTDTNPGGGSSNGIGVRTLIVPANAPASLTYVCGVHGSGMGNSIAVTDVINSTIAGHIDGVVTITNELGSVGETVDFGIIGAELVAPSFLSGPTADARNITVGDVATVLGAIAGNPTPTVSYTWSLDGSPIAGATSSTYTTTATGDSLLAGISASNSEGTITGTADFGSVSAVPESLTKNFAPDFTLANPQPSESLYDNGGHTANQAVGYIEMPERIWTPGATIDFCVSANVVDLEGINKVRVSCHGSTAEVSTITKGSNGVQGYWFAMNLPAGGTTGTPKVYAELIPHNGTSRVVEKEFRSLTPTYVDINVGDLTNDDISVLLGHASGSTGTDNMVLRLGAGTYYLTQQSLGTLNDKWQEVTTNGNVDVTIIPCVDTANLGRTAGTPSLRLDHTIFRGVTFDIKSAQKSKAGRATYVAFQDCNLTDTWWNQSEGGRPFGVFNGGGLSRNELQQLYFDAYSTPVREPVYEVYDSVINSAVGGGAILYHNTTMNCSFDPQYIQLGQYTSGSTAGQAIFERGMHINKLESIGGGWRFGQRNHYNDYMTVTGVTLENGGLDTKVTFSTEDPSDSLQLDRTDIIIGRWDSSEALTTTNREWVNPDPSQSVRVYGQAGSDDLGYVVAENTDWTDDISVGDRVIVCTWAHPDGFQIGRNTVEAGFTGATCDNWLIQDYRVYQDHQPMLFHSSTTAILNCVFDNCSFEQYEPDSFYSLLAQFEGLPKQFAIKNTSMPTTASLSIRNNAAEFSQADMFLIDGCFLQQIGGDAGGETIENCFVTNTVYKQAVNANGISFGAGNSILAADQYVLSNGRISKFGVPQTSVGTSTTRALPYTIAGTARSATREIGAYAVGDTANDWSDYSLWEPFSVAQAEISALSDGDTIDFGVRKFAASDSDHQAGGIDLTARSVGISGGRFSMGKTAAWVDIGDGVYAADHDFSDYRSLMFYLVDQNATTKPLLAVNPSPPSEMDAYRFCYNGNWFAVNNTAKSINNGVVHTVAGDNAYNETILGWTITDATLKSQVNDVLAGVTVGITAGPWTLIHSSSNTVTAARIESWDNASGGLTLAALGGGSLTTYLAYLEFAICGIPGQTLNSGEYTWDLTNGITAARALYKPVNGDASDARIPVSDHCFKLGGGAGVGVTLENVTMEGQAYRGTPGIIQDNGEYGSAIVSNCTITDGTVFARINYTPITFDKCVMRRCSGRGAAVCDGSTFTNNIIDHIESFSGILVQTRDSGLEHTHIENNVLSLEASTHGQGLSLYKDSWRNATIGHNIFYNCQRAHSFQPYDAAGIGVTLAYDYTFENNLVVVDKVLDIQGFQGGQKSISFNGTADTGLSGSDGAQTVTIRNNTVVMTDQVPSYFITANRKQLTSIDIRNIQHSTVVVENNIASTINAPAIDDGVNAGHTHANNLQYVYDNTGSISVTDKLVHTNRDDYLESGTFQGKTVAGGASDGGVLGVRWSTIPTSTQIQQIVSTDDVNWASTYPALSLPAGASYSRAYENTQVWGLTGGGTGDLGPWQSANASWGSDAGYPVYAYGAVGAAGVTGWKPGRNAAYCSPDYSGDNIMWLWDFGGLTLERDNFLNGMSGDYYRLQVTVSKGGSGDNSAGGYYAGNTGQVYNYYWWPNTINTYTSDTLRWTIGDLGTGSDEWPTSGITGHMWGDNPLYTHTFQSTPFSGDGTVSLTYSLTHIGYPEP